MRTTLCAPWVRLSFADQSHESQAVVDAFGIMLRQHHPALGALVVPCSHPSVVPIRPELTPPGLMVAPISGRYCHNFEGTPLKIYPLTGYCFSARLSRRGDATQMVGARFVVYRTVKNTQFVTLIARWLSMYFFYEHAMHIAARLLMALWASLAFYVWFFNWRANIDTEQPLMVTHHSSTYVSLTRNQVVTGITRVPQ